MEHFVFILFLIIILILINICLNIAIIIKNSKERFKKVTKFNANLNSKLNANLNSKLNANLNSKLNANLDNNILLGKFISQDRKNYIIFRDDNIMISDEWGQNQYRYFTDDTVFVSGDDNIDYLRVDINNTSNMYIKVQTISDDYEPNGYYNKDFYKVPS